MSECPLWRYRSAVACRGVSGCSRPRYATRPLEGGSHKPHHRTTRTYTGLGKQTLGGHKQNLVHTRTQEKGAETARETDPDLRMSVQESGRGVGQRWPAAGSGALRAAVHAPDLLKEVAIIFITSTTVCSQVNQQGGNSPAHQQKTGLKTD